jgi:hypothetical protein
VAWFFKTAATATSSSSSSLQKHIREKCQDLTLPRVVVNNIISSIHYATATTPPWQHRLIRRQHRLGKQNQNQIGRMASTSAVDTTTSKADIYTEVLYAEILLSKLIVVIKLMIYICRGRRVYRYNSFSHSGCQGYTSSLLLLR